MTKPLSLPGLAPGSSGKEDDGEGEEGYARVCVEGRVCVCVFTMRKSGLLNEKRSLVNL